MLSSAKIAKYVLPRINNNLQRKTMIKSGTSFDPWGKPVSMFCDLLKTFSTVIRYLRFDK